MSQRTCRRCGRPIVENAALTQSVFEGMHRLCFHLEYEHPGDPDQPCADPSCIVWQLQLFRSRLLELGVDPEEVVATALDSRWSET